MFTETLFYWSSTIACITWQKGSSNSRSCLCGVCMFSPYLHGLPQGALLSFHVSGEQETKTPVTVSTSQCCDGLSRVFSCLLPSACWDGLNLPVKSLNTRLNICTSVKIWELKEQPNWWEQRHSHEKYYYIYHININNQQDQDYLSTVFH